MLQDHSHSITKCNLAQDILKLKLSSHLYSREQNNREKGAPFSSVNMPRLHPQRISTPSAEVYQWYQAGGCSVPGWPLLQAVAHDELLLLPSDNT
jgi:hypothetical protein